MCDRSGHSVETSLEKRFALVAGRTWRPGVKAISLSFRTCLTVAGISLSFSGNGIAAERAVDLELLLAADVSDSMDLEEATLQRQGFVQAFRHPDVIDVIKRGELGRIAVAYVEWAGEFSQSMLVDWTEIANAVDAAAFADAIEAASVQTALWTSISAVIDYGVRQFEDNGFRGERRIIDISGDGPNNKGRYVVHARDQAVAADIVINGLPIVNDRLGPFGFPPLPNLDLYYEDCVIGGPGSFIVVADGFQDFARAIRRKMLLEIAGMVPREALFHLAATRPRPPCDAGEQQLRGWYFDFD